MSGSNGKRSTAGAATGFGANGSGAHRWPACASPSVSPSTRVLSYVSAAPLARDTSLQWALPIRTPANDNARVTLTVRNRADSAQGRVASTTWRVPAFDGTLLLSDLVVGEPRSGILRRGTHQIAPAPGHAVLENTPFRLYYELYGARPGDPLSVTIQVLPGRDESLLAKLKALISSRDAFAVEFDEPASPDADGILRVEREYRADLKPGAYSVVATIRNGRTGETATMDTNLVVVAPLTPGRRSNQRRSPTRAVRVATG